MTEDQILDWVIARHGFLVISTCDEYKPGEVLRDDLTTSHGAVETRRVFCVIGAATLADWEAQLRLLRSFYATEGQDLPNFYRVVPRHPEHVKGEQYRNSLDRHTHQEGQGARGH